VTLIVLRSPKGGVGRTTLTALLGEGLARRGHDVTVMDLDPQDALRFHFGVVDAAQELTRARRLDCVATASGVKRVTQSPVDLAMLLGAGPRAAQLAPLLVQPWLDRPEILLVDIAAAEDACASAVIELADVEIRPLLADAASMVSLPPGFADADQLPQSLFVLNQADHRRPLTQSALAHVRHVVGHRLLGVVRRDEAVPEALASLQALADYAPASAAWADIVGLSDALHARLAQRRAATGLATFRALGA